MKIETVLGLDPSSVKLAIVETTNDRRDVPILHVYHFVHEEIEQKVSEAFDWLFERLMEIRERDGVSPVVYLEAPVMGIGGPGATIPQAFVSGALMAACVQADVVVRLTNNQTWKKRALGHGNLGKPQIREAMKEVWPKLVKRVPIMEKGEFKGFPDPDLIDAGGLNRYGWWHVDLLVKMRKRRGQ